MFVSDDDEDNQSSNSTHTANVVSESEKEEETIPSTVKSANSHLVSKKLTGVFDS